MYGVVSFGASLRTREIGIRVALGAQTCDVLRLILGQGLTLVAGGLLVGLALSIGMSRLLSHFLPLVNAADWTTFGQSPPVSPRWRWSPVICPRAGRRRCR